MVAAVPAPQSLQWPMEVLHCSTDLQVLHITSAGDIDLLCVIQIYYEFTMGPTASSRVCDGFGVGAMDLLQCYGFTIGAIDLLQAYGPHVYFHIFLWIHYKRYGFTMGAMDLL